MIIKQSQNMTERGRRKCEQLQVLMQVQEMAPKCLATACLPGPHYLRRYSIPKSPSWEKEANARKAKCWKRRNCLSEVRFVPTVTTVKEKIGFIKEETKPCHNFPSNLLSFCNNALKINDFFDGKFILIHVYFTKQGYTFK